MDKSQMDQPALCQWPCHLPAQSAAAIPSAMCWMADAQPKIRHPCQTHSEKWLQLFYGRFKWLPNHACFMNRRHIFRKAWHAVTRRTSKGIAPWLFFDVFIFPDRKKRSSLKHRFSVEIFCISTAEVHNPPRKGALQGAVDRSSRIASACWLNWVQLLLTRCMPHNCLTASWTKFLPLQF